MAALSLQRQSILQHINRLQELADLEDEDETSTHHALLKEIRVLQTEIETPIDTCSRLNFQMLQNICLRIAVEKQLLHALVAHDEESVSAGQLAFATGTDLLLVTRIMRLLSAINIISEVSEDTYAANAVTHHQVTPGAIGAIKHHFDLDMAHGGELVNYMRRVPDNTIYQFADEPSGCQTLFDFAHGHPTIFGLLASDTDKGREQKKSFDDYMAAKRPPESMKQWFEIYPAAQQLTDTRADAEAVLIVDVGGGPGQELIGLKQRHPELSGRYVLQDLPITLDRVTALPDGIEKMPYDFFNPQPIKGARAYFMRDVLHNWSDARCTQILHNTVEAMEKDYSTLLIDQYVLSATGADLRAAEMDILMWLHTSGIQRTLPMWEALLGGVGLEVVKVWNAGGGGESVIEACKV